MKRLEFLGAEAKLFIEFELPNGSRVQRDLTTVVELRTGGGWAYSELRIPISGGWLRSIEEDIDEAERRLGP